MTNEFYGLPCPLAGLEAALDPGTSHDWSGCWTIMRVEMNWNAWLTLALWQCRDSVPMKIA